MNTKIVNYAQRLKELSKHPLAHADISKISTLEDIDSLIQLQKDMQACFKPKSRGYYKCDLQLFKMKARRIEFVSAVPNPLDTREYYKGQFEAAWAVNDRLRAKHQEIESAARRVITEVRSLRRRNEVLEAQDRVLGLVGALLFTSPPDGQRGAYVDDVWSLEKLLDNKE